MPIFPTPIDLDADYYWAGLHTFEFIATFEAGIEAEQITSAGGLTTTLASGGQGQYFFGANPIYLMSATEFRPAEALTAVTLGSATRKWTNVYSVNGDFTGNINFNGNRYIQRNGVNVLRFGAGVSCYTSFSPGSDNAYELGVFNLRWSKTWSMDGSFSGNLDTEVGGSNRTYILGTDGDTDTEYLSIGAGTFSGFGIYATGTGAGATNRQIELLTNSRKSGLIAKADSVELYGNSTSFAKFAVTNSSTYSRQDFRPHTTGNYDCGNATYRWATVGSVDADFSGNIKAENLPTSDPGVPGQFYVTTGGSLKVSQ